MEKANEFTGFLRKSDELTEQLSKKQEIAVCRHITKDILDGVRSYMN